MKNNVLLMISGVYTVFCFYFYSITKLPIWFIYLFIASNILAFIFYGMDKLSAIRQWQRTPEKHFYLLALLSGWPASLLGQIVFNHKTTKIKFRRWFYIMSFINVFLVLSYLIYLGA